MKKRVLSMLMALVMIVSLVPTAFAAPAEPTQPETKTYTGSDGITVTATSVTGGLPAPSGLVVGLGKEDPAALAAVKAKILEQYEGGEFTENPQNPFVNSVEIKNNSEVVNFPADTTYVLEGMMAGTRDSKFFHYDGKQLIPLKSTMTDDSMAEWGCVFFKVESSTLENIVTFDSTGFTLKPTEPNPPKYKPGIYTVTADLFVDGTNNVVIPGLTAYISNYVDFPPNKSLAYNAKLEIKGNGEMFMTLPELNNIFKLAKIDGPTDNVKITDRVMMDMDLGCGYKQCISGLTFQLLDDNGHYEFSDCTEMPMIIDEAQREKHMPLWMNVDFTEMKPGFDDSKKATVFTYQDETTQSTVTISTSEQELIDTLNKGAVLKGEFLKSGHDFEAAEAAFGKKVATHVPHDLFRYSLTVNGRDVALTGNTKVGFAIQTRFGYPKIAVIENGGYQELKAKGTPGTVIFETVTPTLGVFAIRDVYFSGELIELSNTDGRFSYRYTHECSHGQIAGSSSKALKPKSKQTAEGTEWYFTIASDGYTERGTGTYDPGYSTLTATLPCPQGQHVYLVHKYQNGEYNKWIKLYERPQTEIAPLNGERMVSINVMPDGLVSDFDEFDTQKNRLGNDIMGGLINPYYGVEPKDNPVNPHAAYILVTDRAMVEIPNDESVFYNGQEQTCPYLNEPHYVVTGETTAKDAGKYTVSVAPKEGYTFLDGTTAPVEVIWTIRKRTLIYGFEQSMVEEGASISRELVYLEPTQKQRENLGYGFAQGENESNVPGFVRPTVDFKPEYEQVGEHYRIPVQHTDTQNYTVAGSCNLIVLPKGTRVVELPKDFQHYDYTGELIQGVPESPDYILVKGLLENETYEATLTGEYIAYVKPVEGAVWASSGTDERAQIYWYIDEPGTNKPVEPENPGGGSGGGGSEKPVTETVTANLYLPGKYNKQVPGLTAYMTNPKNPVEGTGVPTTPVADNAKLTTKPDGTMTLTLKLVNPVFTLQKIGTANNATIINEKRSSDMAYLNGVNGKYDDRISQLTIELEDTSGEYVFKGCDLFPTLLNTDWLDLPLVLAVKFDGGDDSDLEHGGQVDPGVIPGMGDKEEGEEVTDASAFTDVAKDAYYKDAVAWAVEKGITKGTTGTTFSPNKTCTRAQNVTFLWRAAGSPEPKTAMNPFTDVPADAYYAKAVLWAVEKGVTKGTTETTFSPDAPCNRGQTVTFLWRLDGSKQAKGSNPFTDVTADSYCYDAVLWAVKNGITNGKTASTFVPTEACSRGQIVTFLYRQMGKDASTAK